MASIRITPGVYNDDKNAFPGSAVAVETSLPVFIGYTEKAVRKGKSLMGIPTRVGSFGEYVEFFGQGYPHKFNLATGSLQPFNPTLLTNPVQFFYFYNCIRLFYQNGGNNCYIICVGTYGDSGEGPGTAEIRLADFTDEIFAILEKEYEPAIVVVPDIIAAFKNNEKECYLVYKKVLKHCHDTRSRFAILDVNYDDVKTDIKYFRENIGTDYLSFGAAYYPWLQTSIVTDTEVGLNNLACLPEQLKIQLPEAEVTDVFAHWDAPSDTDTIDQKEIKYTHLHQVLLTVSPVYNQIMDEIRSRLNLLPPAAAMAGVYALVDTSRGVWKAPANISLAMVDSPSVNITNEEQQTMNVDALGGKSINVIRPFPGIGTLVWGARTLDGNSLDWRYINVRRTMIMIEQSLKLSCRAYIFEPNDSGTWVTMKSMMVNFLANLWKQGALAGEAPEQAFDVQIGLGATMTPTDILDGYLRVTVKVAIVRPAEFIVVTFQQLQQQS